MQYFNSNASLRASNQNSSLPSIGISAFNPKSNRTSNAANTKTNAAIAAAMPAARLAAKLTSKLAARLASTIAMIAILTCIQYNTANAITLISDDADTVAPPNIYNTTTLPSIRKIGSFYIGGGLGLTGMAFNVDGTVLSNGFITQGATITTNFRGGYQFTPGMFYLAVEGFASLNFLISGGADVSGAISISNNISNNISLHSGNSAAGYQYFGINVKPGITFNNKKGAVYAIIGVAYNLMTGSYTETSPASSGTFDVSGVRLNYGFGVKHDVMEHMSIYMEFNSLAPIGVSNGSLTPTNSVATTTNINSYEVYSFTVGAEFKI